jgi:hypothetical protein
MIIQLLFINTQLSNIFDSFVNQFVTIYSIRYISDIP